MASPSKHNPLLCSPFSNSDTCGFRGPDMNSEKTGNVDFSIQSFLNSNGFGTVHTRHSCQHIELLLLMKLRKGTEKYSYECLSCTAHDKRFECIIHNYNNQFPCFQCLPSVWGAGKTRFFIQCITYTHWFLNVNEFRLRDWAVDVTCDILISVHKRLTVRYWKPTISRNSPSRCEKKQWAAEEEKKTGQINKYHLPEGKARQVNHIWSPKAGVNQAITGKNNPKVSTAFGCLREHAWNFEELLTDIRVEVCCDFFLH